MISGLVQESCVCFSFHRQASVTLAWYCSLHWQASVLLLSSFLACNQGFEMMADNFTDMFGPGVGVQKVHLTKNGQVSSLKGDNMHSLQQGGRASGLGRDGGLDDEGGLGKEEGINREVEGLEQEEGLGSDPPSPCLFTHPARLLPHPHCVHPDQIIPWYSTLNTMPAVSPFQTFKSHAAPVPLHPCSARSERPWPTHTCRITWCWTASLLLQKQASP